jgi:hypothetical protein
MNLDHRLDKLEDQLDAASAEIERQRTGSLWDLISLGQFERALGGWDVARRVAWAMSQGDRHHTYGGEELPVEDIAHARSYAARLRELLWPEGQPEGLSGAALLSDIKQRLRFILLGEPSKPHPQTTELSRETTVTPDNTSVSSHT